MVWALLKGAFGVASEEGAEDEITLFGAVMLVYAWSMYVHLKRQQAKRRRQTSRNLPGTHCHPSIDT